MKHSKLPVCIVRWQPSAPNHRLWCSKIWAVALWGSLALGNTVTSTALATDRATSEQRIVAPSANSALDTTPKNAPEQTQECLSEGGGFLRARLTGSIKAELNWINQDTECSGATRPSGGVRMRFSHAYGKGSQRLVLVFGIPGLREGVDARELPVNVTIIREGAGQFFGTRGDDKCMIDRLHQEALAGIPLRNRRYRIIASGFCIQPARAIAGDGSILITRFDFAGRVDYSEEDRTPDDRMLANDAQKDR